MDCSQAESLYGLNDEVAAEAASNAGGDGADYSAPRGGGGGKSIKNIIEVGVG